MYIFIENGDESLETLANGDPAWNDEIPFWSRRKKVLEKEIRRRYEPEWGELRYDSDTHALVAVDGNVLGWIREIKKELT